jgi:DNA-binding response OmpR family regulator
MVPIDIAIRLANEGVPVQAIARATGWSYADVHAQLQTAQSDGSLVAIPCADWPAGYTREQKLLHLSHSVLNNKADLEKAIHRVFHIPPRLAQILLLLLQHPEVHRDRFAHLTYATTGLSNVTAVHVSYLRGKLQKFGLTVQTIYGYGYRMSPEHQRKALNLIFNAT